MFIQIPHTPCQNGELDAPTPVDRVHDPAGGAPSLMRDGVTPMLRVSAAGLTTPQAQLMQGIPPQSELSDTVAVAEGHPPVAVRHVVHPQERAVVGLGVSRHLPSHHPAQERRLGLRPVLWVEGGS